MPLLLLIAPMTLRLARSGRSTELFKVMCKGLGLGLHSKPPLPAHRTVRRPGYVLAGREAKEVGGTHAGGTVHERRPHPGGH